eukprot:1469195-Prymnesium_polylepis.1
MHTAAGRAWLVCGGFRRSGKALVGLLECAVGAQVRIPPSTRRAFPVWCASRLKCVRGQQMRSASRR